MVFDDRFNRRHKMTLENDNTIDSKVLIAETVVKTARYGFLLNNSANVGSGGVCDPFDWLCVNKLKNAVKRNVLPILVIRIRTIKNIRARLDKITLGLIKT